VGNFGGGIFNSGTLYIIDSSIRGNSDYGGSIYAYPAAAETILVGSTVNGNTDIGLFNQGGVLKLSNSTISGNGGEGIKNISTGQVTVASSTVSGNGGDYGGMMNDLGSTVVMRNSIVAENLGVSSADLNGAFTSDGHNVIGISDGSTGFVDGSNGDRIGTAANPLDPQIGTLGDNGGPTFTHALFFSSPARDSGNPTGCTDADNNPLTTDQRGLARLFGSSCDIGSFEYNFAYHVFLPHISE
jgi:hypothetical protein